jgi:hypothetical protein
MNTTMRRILLKVWILVLTFGFGISVSALWRIYTLPALPEIISVTEPQADARIVFPDARPFVAVMHACGPQANYHVYQSSNGERIVESCEIFSSTSATARALKRRMGKAEIIKRYQNLDDNGLPFGETVVVLTESAMKLSTHGKSLCVTEAPSLAQLRRFEHR